MQTIRKTGWVAIAIALAAASQLPRFLRADSAADQVAVVAQLSLADLAAQAIDADSAISRPAIDKLRAAGPAGLDALRTANKSQIAIHRGGAVVAKPSVVDAAWPRITAALDTVAAQRNAYASGLYWYTDLTAAEAAAKASGKPILSLRLLGKLNDEYSCANSRFFRTVLYANNEVSQHLRNHFILHWQSVRPVPVITIDFGDGRMIRRTITGNSIHYVLTADGKVVDGIPGLYGARAFLRELAEVEHEWTDLTGQPAADRSAALALWHAKQFVRIAKAFDADRASLGLAAIPALPPSTGTGGFTGHDPALRTPGSGSGSFPSATSAGTRTFSKMVVERPLLGPFKSGSDAKLHGDPADPLIQTKEIHDLTDADWSRIASLHADDAVLDAGSALLIAAKTPDAATAAPLAMTKFRAESPLVRMMRNFQRSIAEDTVRNEYLFHLQIHRWLADPSAALAADVSALNKRVYAELFLTPDSDPWLGLVPADTYSALDDGGVCH